MNITVNEVFDYLTKRGVIGGIPLLSEAKEKGVKKRMEGETSVPRPKIGITEDWGRPDSDAGILIRKYAEKIPGDTLATKLAGFKKFALEGGATTIGEIMATIVLLDCLYGLMTEFSASSGGFIFESFLAGLMGGIQIPVAGGNIQITDMIKRASRTEGDKEEDYEIPFSMKLLTAKGGEVSGALSLLYKGLMRHGLMVYWVGLKEGDKSGVKFYDFTITKEAVEQRLDGIKLEDWFIGRFKLLAEEYENQDEIKALIDANREAIIEQMKDPKFRNSITVMGKTLKIGSMGSFKFLKTGYSKAGPLEGSPKEAGSWGTSLGLIGELGVGPEALKKVAEQYAEQLDGEFNTIFDALEKLSGNVTDYFLNDDKRAGAAAQSNAQVLKSETDRIVSSGKQMELDL